jgi:hypothetical protein
MSVVSGILSGLEYIRRMSWKIPSNQSGLTHLSWRVPSVGLSDRHECFSPSFGNEFNREELARRAINESLARMPVAR